MKSMSIHRYYRLVGMSIFHHAYHTSEKTYHYCYAVCEILVLTSSEGGKGRNPSAFTALLPCKTPDIHNTPLREKIPVRLFSMICLRWGIHTTNMVAFDRSRRDLFHGRLARRLHSLPHGGNQLRNSPRGGCVALRVVRYVRGGSIECQTPVQGFVRQARTTACHIVCCRLTL